MTTTATAVVPAAPATLSAPAPGRVPCAACAAPDARWSAALGLPLCAGCARAATDTTDREPVLLGDLLPVTAACLRIPPPRRTARPRALGERRERAVGRPV
ncbi:hypothetical protein NX801_06385 [Streptomyces sp. LP05-1]|uniref:Uncharacterized protein n=1 Tax=Streptomyces pyxinae TaxID=2970734 RepID=A0ABT2CCZ5_9ACTN|nr:hypothetical protein [Streptomyces sp. LP05-1]MCS0635289.1 hypothetical protein [Streptomyces sp. LP05-1]